MPAMSPAVMRLQFFVCVCVYVIHKATIYDIPINHRTGAIKILKPGNQMIKLVS